MPVSVYGNAYLDPVYAQRKPTTADNTYQIDQEWVDMSVIPYVVYKLVYVNPVAPYPATWIAIGSSKLNVYEVTDPGTTLTATLITAVDDVITTGAPHGLYSGQALQFSGALLPPEMPVSPLVVYAKVASPTTLTVSLAPGGADINFSIDGSGDYNTFNGATDTPIIDYFDGVIVTNTAAIPDQTLQAPTDLTPGKTFIVINDLTSTDAFNVLFGGGAINLLPGQAQKFIWDGAAWTVGSGIDADDVDFVPYGELTEVTVQAAINKLVDIRWHLRVYNGTGGVLGPGKVLIAAGHDAGSNTLSVDVAGAVADSPVGFANVALADGVTGYMLKTGVYLSALDTSAAAIGDPVYFTVGGDLTLVGGSAVVGKVISIANPGYVFIDIASGAGSGHLSMDSAADPAIDAAVSTAIIDAHDGIVVTLTAAGNSQTLPIAGPTDTTAGKEFTVAVTAASGTYYLPLTYSGGTILIHASESPTFLWDGAEWTLKGDALFKDSAEYLTPNHEDRTVRAASTARLVTRAESGVIPAATTYTDIGLAVAAGHTVKDSSVTAVNMALVAAKVRIAHVPSGGGITPPGDGTFVCYDFEMDPDSCLGWSIPTLHAGDKIIVYTDVLGVTFRVSGNDIAAVKSDQVDRLALGAALVDIFTATDGRHIEELKIVNRDATDTVVTVYAKEAATASAVDAICRFEIPGELWVTLRDLETHNIHLANAQKLSALAAAAGRINIIVYAK